MEKAKKTMEIHVKAFERIYDEISEQLTIEKCNSIRVQSSMKVLDEKVTSMNELNQLLMDQMLSSDNIRVETIDEEMQKWDTMMTTYHELKLKVDKKILQPTISTTSICTELKKTRKLPVIEFKKFGGDLKEWLSFWSQFRRIDEDTDIENEDKFSYLIQSTIPNSRARQLVESYPQTSENYIKVIESLKQRFGRHDLLVEVYVRELLKLILSNTNKKTKLSLFYDKIESQLRALETLGVTSDTCAAMLYPLVESCLNEELIRVWQRSSYFTEDATMKKRLDQLMLFLRKEVESEDRIALAVAGFENGQEKRQVQPTTTEKKGKISTAADLINNSVLRCYFCAGDHFTDQCTQATTWPLETKREKLAKEGCCFSCLRYGHVLRRCKARVTCKKCRGKHVTVMCSKNEKRSTENIKKNPVVREENVGENPTEPNLANQTYNETLLMTMVVQLKGAGKTKPVRVMLDTGSSKSYITKNAANEKGYQSIGQERLVHSLFGGSETKVVEHNCYNVHLRSLSNDYTCNFDVLDQPIICKNVVSVREGPWSTELQNLGVEITDKNSGPIEILIGSDVIGKLLTGEKHELSCGLVALRTLLGWTLMGKVEDTKTEISSHAMLVPTMFVQDAPVSKLWSLDVLGIKDPIERKTLENNDKEVMDHFLSTVKRKEDGRYQVEMPWIEEHPPLPTNFYLAEKRLKSSVKKLKHDDYYENYKEVFNNWLEEGIIETVSNAKPIEEVIVSGHFLTHHPVYNFKSTTTPIRPVFNASAKIIGAPSLNDCLEKGKNLIEMIPSMLLKFRLQKIGVIADIRKAFLQIELAENDREFLKFLWYYENGELKIYRHARVVFGINCSPFLLGAVLDYHLENARNEKLKETYPIEVVEKLSTAFYVDNVVASVKDSEELEIFVENSKKILAETKFELRGWEYTTFNDNVSDAIQNVSNVLGLNWNRNQDTLNLSLKWFENFDTDKVTKRKILSAAHKLYDPIGFCCPVALIPKCLLQKLWKVNVGWDEKLDDETKEKFLKWLREIPCLAMVNIPRWISPCKKKASSSIHVFCDASEVAYATCIFLRAEEEEGRTYVTLLEAKSRVAPTKKNKDFTVPRLELLAATIGARLYDSMRKEFSEVKTYYYTDSTTVLSWIKRENSQWKLWISNRVEEIRRLTNPREWFHVPGEKNPADLPSRGCSAMRLADGKWWEGPEWLREPIETWLSQNFVCNEEEINEEKRKTIVVSTLLVTEEDNFSWYKRAAKFSRIVSLIGWIKRFSSNCRQKIKTKRRKEKYLVVSEIKEAEKMIVRLIQEESFEGKKDPKLATLCTLTDKDGLIRIQTKVSDSKYSQDFRYPYVLPSRHEVVKKWILYEHKINLHAGIQTMISILRERFWILQCRKTVKSVLAKCTVCQRFTAQPLESPPISLPEERVRQAAVFEISGVDLAGPLYLNTGEKVWICLFTCAVYRAVHLELVSSLSTDTFIQALRRFIARRGRPTTIFSDNGKNFVGCENALKALNWDEITRETAIKKIEWKFIPPTAAWWGGWWERLVRMMKETLRKVLGKASLSYEDLLTILCDCEAILNSRPLTYLPEDAENWVVLTPSMFLQEVFRIGVPDLDAVEKKDLRKYQRYRLELRKSLKKRFKSEYLGYLKLTANKQKQRPTLKIGDIVLIMDFNVKNVNWPLGKILELFLGRDGNSRVVKIKTMQGEVVRPIQRLCRLEMDYDMLPQEKLKMARPKEAQLPEDGSVDVPNSDEPNEISNTEPSVQMTRFGRIVKKNQPYEFMILCH